MNTPDEPTPKTLPPGVRLEIDLDGLTWGNLLQALSLIDIDPGSEVQWNHNDNDEVVSIIVEGRDF